MTPRAAARLTTTITAALALTLAAGGCGDDEDPSAGPTTGTSAGSASGTVVVSAATSLKTALTAYGGELGGLRARFSFAGSDALAAQIEQGVKPDVFASANTTLPEELHAAGLVEEPRTFTANRLVIGVPKDSTIRAIGDLEKPGVAIAAGSASVPVGSYTRKVLAGLPAARRTAILGNVRSNEPDVGGVVGKLTQGAVDAGFVYVTDVAATDGRLRAVPIPDELEPQAAYGVAVVVGAKNPSGARRFVDGLVAGAGQRALAAAGFLPPPTP